VLKLFRESLGARVSRFTDMPDNPAALLTLPGFCACKNSADTNLAPFIKGGGYG